MDKLTFDQVLEYLKSASILRDDKGNYLHYNNHKVKIINKGSRFSLSIKDFVTLYQDDYYLMSNSENLIEIEKDLEYYVLERNRKEKT